MIKNIKQTKEKILEALENKKDFKLFWAEEVTYSKTIKAKDEEEARKIFFDGEIDDITDNDVVEGRFCDDCLE
ncbi:hypothetical protein LCGC14_2851310, partial [marine sediment metagenome]